MSDRKMLDIEYINIVGGGVLSRFDKYGPNHITVTLISIEEGIEGKRLEDRYALSRLFTGLLKCHGTRIVQIK